VVYLSIDRAALGVLNRYGSSYRLVFCRCGATPKVLLPFLYRVAFESGKNINFRNQNVCFLKFSDVVFSMVFPTAPRSNLSAGFQSPSRPALLPSFWKM